MHKMGSTHDNSISNMISSLTSAAFCSSSDGMAKSSTAKAGVGESVAIAAIEASDVLMNESLSHDDDDVSS